MQSFYVRVLDPFLFDNRNSSVVLHNDNDDMALVINVNKSEYILVVIQRATNTR